MFLQACRIAPAALTGLLLLLRSCNVAQGTCSAEQLVKFSDAGDWPKSLDSTVYWFGPNDTAERSTGQPSQFYDPSKPTLMYVHGWTGYGAQAGVETCRRSTSECEICTDKRVLSKPWLEQGWNFGIFYWDQFADEPCTRDTELKIWVNPAEPKGLAWKSYDQRTGKVVSKHLTTGVPSLGHMCALAVRQAMPTFGGPSFRIAGLSLGAQLAAHCAQLLTEETDGHPARPSRLVLLDPFFTGSLQHMGRVIRKHPDFLPLEHWLIHKLSTCGAVRDDTTKRSVSYGRIGPDSTIRAVKELWHVYGVPTELYKGSFLTTTHYGGDPVYELESLASYVVQHLDTGYCHHDAVNCGHSSLVPLYMLRLGDQPGEKCAVPGPLCSDAGIRIFVERQMNLSAAGKIELWTQVGGTMTVHTSDDTYKYEVAQAPTAARLAPSIATKPGAYQPPFLLLVVGASCFFCCAAWTCLGVFLHHRSQGGARGRGMTLSGEEDNCEACLSGEAE